ncbi:NADP-dependent oxidoreductase domain-containing protein [Peziza echinospora]|nr:NADP-dependent oxidoreductase domain-containing protein [Peziza echinospora]
MASTTTSTSKVPVGVIFGGSLFSAHTSFFGTGYSEPTTEELGPIFDKIKELDIPIDTARLYPEVEAFYLHAPDFSSKANIEETLDAVNEVYLTGGFEKFALSNFRPDDVVKIHAYCTSKNYVRPTLYSGPYSLLTRLPETHLLPILRNLGIAFLAYSPLAGGLLLMTPHELETRGGRWARDIFLGAEGRKSFDNPPYHTALLEFEKLSQETGISRLELSVRWIMHHSALKGECGDAVIVGVSRVQQVQEAWDVYLGKGPIEDEEVVRKLDGLWEYVKMVAVLDNMNRDIKL